MPRRATDLFVQNLAPNMRMVSPDPKAWIYLCSVTLPIRHGETALTGEKADSIGSDPSGLGRELSARENEKRV